MRKKVLILAGSPRKGGNSDILCDSFMEGATKAGHDVEKIYVADKNINYCRGCGACEKTGVCVQKDDMAEILDKMLAAHVIVLASPVYFYTISGQMKTLIDRTVARYTQMQNKEFYYIVTAADTDAGMMERSIECFRGFALDCLEGTVEKGIIYGVGVWQKGAVQNTPAVKKAYEAGLNV